jgi:hypothetical protein
MELLMILVHWHLEVLLQLTYMGSLITLFSALELTLWKGHRTGVRRFDALIRAKVALHLKSYLAFLIDLDSYFHYLAFL